MAQVFYCLHPKRSGAQTGIEFHVKSNARALSGDKGVNQPLPKPPPRSVTRLVYAGRDPLTLTFLNVDPRCPIRERRASSTIYQPEADEWRDQISGGHLCLLGLEALSVDSPCLVNCIYRCHCDDTN